MKKRTWIVFLFGIVLIASGCVASAIEKIPGKIVKVVTKPILGFAAADSKTTLAWIDQQVTDGKLTVEQAIGAKKCPDAVIALDALRKTLLEPTEVEGKKGLIYFGTIKKYGGDPTATVRDHLNVIVAYCIGLLPNDTAVVRALGG